MKQLQKIINVIHGSIMGQKQKNFCYELVKEISSEFSLLNHRAKKQEMINIGLYDLGNYDTLLKKLLDIAVMFGFDKYQLQTMEYSKLDWVIRNSSMPIDKKRFDSVYSQVSLYVTLNHRFPEDINQLRDFVKENKNESTDTIGRSK